MEEVKYTIIGGTILFLVLIILIILLISRNKTAYSRGYSAGHAEGYQMGSKHQDELTPDEKEVIRQWNENN